MKKIRIAFDIDGVIITKNKGLNLEIFNLLVLLSHMKNVEIVAWSGGGEEYTRQIIKKYELEEYISDCYSKHTFGGSVVDHVDIAFDDIPEFNLADKNIII